MRLVRPGQMQQTLSDPVLRQQERAALSPRTLSRTELRIGTEGLELEL